MKAFLVCQAINKYDYVTTGLPTISGMFVEGTVLRFSVLFQRVSLEFLRECCANGLEA